MQDGAREGGWGGGADSRRFRVNFLVEYKQLFC